MLRSQGRKRRPGEVKERAMHTGEGIVYVVLLWNLESDSTMAPGTWKQRILWVTKKTVPCLEHVNRPGSFAFSFGKSQAVTDRKPLGRDQWERALWKRLWISDEAIWWNSQWEEYFWNKHVVLAQKVKWREFTHLDKKLEGFFATKKMHGEIQHRRNDNSG